VIIATPNLTHCPLALAAAQHTTVEHLVKQVLEGLAGADPPSAAGPSLSAQDRGRAFDDWMQHVRQRAGRYPNGFVVDDEREHIYAGRGE